jgi:ATP-dependent helicase/nuclease subunit B
VIEHDKPLWASAQPWDAIVAAVGVADGGDPARAWLVPGVEHLAPLRAALGRYLRHNGRPAQAAPWILTVDGLARRAGAATQLQLVAAIDGLLKDAPLLTGQLSAAQRWSLAQEYYGLALQYAAQLPQSAAMLAGYSARIALAGPETAVVRLIAESYADELADSLPASPEPGRWAAVRELLWVWDGEPQAAWWVEQYAAAKTIRRFDTRVDLAAFDHWAPWTAQAHLQRTADPEMQARQAVATVMRWLAEDMARPIAVAVLDRSVARRVRALLEREGVLVQDRSGWALSTTRAAAWLKQWVDWLAQPTAAGLHGILEPEWLDDPPWLTDAAFRRALLGQWRSLGEHAQWPELAALGRSLAEQPAHAAQMAAPWRRFSAAVERWLSHGAEHSSLSLSGWAEASLQLLSALGIAAHFRHDAAGAACVGLLRMLARAGLDAPVAASQWSMVWAKVCEQERFEPLATDSPVRMLPLSALRLQRCERVLVLGCAERLFLPSPPGLLPPAVAAEMGLPGPLQKREQQFSVLVELMATAQECVLLHAEHNDGQAERLSGLLERLTIYWHRRAAERASPWLQIIEPGDDSLPRQMTQRLAPVIAAGFFAVPAVRLSVAAASDLAACPLRFALQRTSGWIDEPQALGLAGVARGRGELIHAVIEAFYGSVTFAALQQGDLDALSVVLDRALTDVWKSLPRAQQALLYGERRQWQRVARPTLRLLSERARAGWMVVALEERAERSTTFGRNGRTLTIHGRCDLLERRADDATALRIVDIKTGNSQNVQRQAAQPLSWPQLAAYQWLLDAPAAQLDFLNIGTREVVAVPVEPPDDGASDGWGERWILALRAALTRLADDAEPARPLPGAACAHCPVAGACRAAWWSPAALSDTVESPDR